MPIDPNRIACKDGVVFFVKERATGAIVVSALREDPVSLSCGLARFQTARAGERHAEHQGMPVEAVRAYAMGHGGVAEGGAVAIALLKRLPSRNVQGAPEGASAAGFRPAARGPNVAGRASAAPSAGAPLERDSGGSGEVEVDTLTPLVIAARKAIAELDGPHLYEGREPTTDQEALVVWGRRGSTSLRLSGHLREATLPRFASHPLREEALALRERMEAHLLLAIPHISTRTERRAG
jgi:hypothetical protein